MHLLLTDRLSCPRCGEGFGLILLADRLEDRRVIEGALGCPNCRDRFPVVAGFADLRPPPRPALPEAPSQQPADPDEADRLAAMLGVTGGPANVALVGPLTAHAGALADQLPHVEVLAVGLEAQALPEREGVSRMITGAGLPFHPGSLRAIAVSGRGGGLLERPEVLARVVARGGRIVVQGPTEEARAHLDAARARVMAGDERWLVAVRETG